MQHVCPYCETVHLNPTYLVIPFKGQEHEFAGFRCPECGAEILSDHEVNLSLKKIHG